MKDAGCGEETVTRICSLYADGQVKDAVKVLRRHRCSLIEQLHESQSKVDCLDFLVRKMEKNQNIMQNMQGKDGNANGRDYETGIDK